MSSTPTFKFGIHTQVTFQSTTFSHSCMTEGGVHLNLMDVKQMTSTFSSYAIQQYTVQGVVTYYTAVLTPVTGIKI